MSRSSPTHVDDHQSPRQIGGHLHAVGEAAGDVALDDQAVHHDLDRVLLVLVQPRWSRSDHRGNRPPGSGHSPTCGRPPAASGGCPSSPAPKGHDLDAGGLGSVRTWSMIWSMVCCMISLPHLGQWGGPPGPEEAQVVVDLGHRTHRGAGFSRWSSGRWRWRGRVRRCSPHRASPSAPKTSGHRRRGTPTYRRCPSA